MKNMHFTYCPHCGKKLISKEIGDEGMIPFCENCNIPMWDMFSTCVIAAVVNECGEIALLRQNYVSATKYVCVAGIMKIGESAEETVIREIKEEIGQDVEELEFEWVKCENALSLLREGSVAWQLVKTVIGK